MYLDGLGALSPGRIEKFLSIHGGILGFLAAEQQRKSVHVRLMLFLKQRLAAMLAAFLGLKRGRHVARSNKETLKSLPKFISIGNGYFGKSLHYLIFPDQETARCCFITQSPIVKTHNKSSVYIIDIL